jgi:microsomal epoxide hydrolase
MKLHLTFSNAVLLCLGLAVPAHAQIPQTKSGFVTTADGAKIHYLEVGERHTLDLYTGPLRPPPGETKRKTQALGRPALLFVPGWTMPAWIWEHQIAHFAKTHRVVAMDPRGQGESSKPRDGYFPAVRARDIKTVIDELKLAPVALVGWSMGVNEIAAYVDQFGTEGLAGIVLVDGVAGGYEDQMLTGFLKWSGGILKDREKSTGPIVRSMFRNPEVLKDEAYLERLERAVLQTPTDATIALLVGSSTSDFRAALAKIDKPTLIVTAPNQYVGFDAMYAEMAKSIPGARHEVFPNAGHALFVDDPARFNALLDDFLRP